MNDGGVTVDIASCYAYDAPGTLVKHQIYEKAEYEEAEFIRFMTSEANMASGDYSKPGMAYMLSKNFVIWYAQKCAHEYVKKGIRVVSVSPGLIETVPGTQEMEMPESEEKMIGRTCEHRKGKPGELGFAIATIADERNGYLCGIDIRVDGGASTGEQFKEK